MNPEGRRLFVILGLNGLAGSLSALSMAPVNAWPVLFLTLSVLYLTLHEVRARKTAFACGWFFGFGYFVFGLYWIGNALLIDGNPYQWAWPLAVCGLPAVLALFTACAGVLIHQGAPLAKMSGWFGFAGIFSLAEWLRGHLFTGFPWNLFGYTWADTPPVLQILSFSDIYGLTFLTLLWSTLPAFVWLAPSGQRRPAILFALGSALLVLTFGVWRIHNISPAFHENLKIRIVQPNINQAEKWDRTLMTAHFEELLRLSESQDQETVTTYIIWPETALSFRFTNDPYAMSLLKETLSTYKTPATLFTGLLSYDPEKGQFSNALAMIDSRGQIKNQYNKSHLVPFGEYIPFQKWIPLAPIAAFSGFHTGNGPETFSTNEGLKYSPLVCYEIIFPEHSIATDGPAPDFILNVTNDAWYGISPGPYQHFTQARFRAIETGLPVIRSANTGFSGIIAPDGTVLGQATLFTAQADTLPLPRQTTLTVTTPFFKTTLFLVFMLACTTLSFAKKIL